MKKLKYNNKVEKKMKKKIVKKENVIKWKKY